MTLHSSQQKILDLNKPEYRIRLFISVDIVESTSYKSARPLAEWRKTFVSFFTTFPDRIDTHISRRRCSHLCSEEPLLPKPKIWRTRGDEIIFVIRAMSVCQVMNYLEAFHAAMQEYPSVSDGLELKGNAWTAAFPAPNVTVFTGSHNNFASRDFLDTGVLSSPLPTEELECIADQSPSYFDFLGGDMDAGFRVAKNSKSHFMTMSASLAYLVCCAARESELLDRSLLEKFSVERLEVFKGIAKGQGYPVLGFLSNADLVSLKSSDFANALIAPRGKAQNLVEGLSDIMERYGFEIPHLPLFCGGKVDVKSPSYSEFLRDWIEVREVEKEVSCSDQEVAEGKANPRHSAGKTLDWMTRNKKAAKHDLQ